jgi:hypothetical protein
MKPRQVADMIGFVSYYYAVNRRLPERHVIDFALRESSPVRPNGHARPAFDTGRRTAFDADTQLERQEERLAAPRR